MATGEWAGIWLPIASAGALIFSLFASYLLGRHSRRIDLVRHNNSVARQLADDNINETIRKMVLIETTMGLLIQQEIDRISDLTLEEFLNELKILNEYNPEWPHDKIAAWVRRAFTKENLKEVGKATLAKILGILNKAAGMG